MTNHIPNTLCNDQRLQAILHADDGSNEFRAAAKHVELCANCQTRLTELAAAAEEWRDARRSLEVRETDEQFSAELSHRSWSRDNQRARTLTWSDTLSRQLLAPPSHPEMLGRIGRYEVERVIGAGGMGVVFKAFDTELNRPVAVKVLAPHLSGNGAARQRFAREARAAAAVVHEHVVAIHNVESDGASPFLVMQFVAGESLQARLDRTGALELCELLRIGRQTAAGLAAAHAQGLVHRDVKPSNILLEQGIERTLLTDFGLARASDDARLTHTGYHPGTPHYMSPEQARGESIDARSDLFSLGSVLYTMATGRPPFRAETAYGILRRITDAKPHAIHDVNPAIPAWLEAIINKLLAKQPDDRFDSAEEVTGVLEQCLAHVQQPAVVPLPAVCQHRNSLAKLARKHWVSSGVMVASLSLLIAIPLLLQLGRDQGKESSSHADGSALDISGWDDAEQLITNLRRTADDLEHRVTPLWDVEFSSIPVTTTQE